ncbi:ABC transporter ATP-binding protein [Polaromonas sp.]|uniref:ABC transporter ATP-binding protein n=1 Tax=Polaromonas sp. TaxID=1869339 RepID=UPI00248772A7|nr:ABC transporter ATP-binding protein [Polaromonas sp.]MDI1273064.1 ABC transporter ATP-binding protein [Polaromonas sp.]
MQFCLLFLLMILASFAEAVSIGAVLPFLGVLTAPERVFAHPLTQPFIQALGLTEPKQLLLPLTIAFAMGALFSGVIRLVLLWAQIRLGHAVGADFSISIYRRTLYQPYAVHVARNSSEVIAGITNKANIVVHQMVLPALTILSSSLMLFTILVALLAIEPLIAFAAFVGFGVIYALVILVTKKRLMRDGQRISREQNQVVKALQEGLGGIRDVLIDGTQAAYCNIYRSADLPLRRATANVQIISSSPRFAIEALGMVLISALAFSMVGRPGGIANAIPVLGALALGAQRLLPVLQQAYSSWTSMLGAQASLSDALDLLDQPLPAHADAPPVSPLAFRDRITLNQLAFRYTLGTPWVLRGVDLDIPKGSRIGFMGTTGSGKSTLLDLIMGLLHPVAGSLAVDGVNITAQNHRAWQSHIAHVPQAIFLADATIAENIAFGMPLDQIDHARVRQAAQKAQIAQDIDSWSQQYNTVVGERGVRLSGGQRQRIGIARALYKKADVIVFDEATSALDNETELAVMEAIENLGEEITVLIVAHRLTTLQNCTHVVDLSDGQIKRSGSYQDIVEQTVSTNEHPV